MNSPVAGMPKQYIDKQNQKIEEHNQQLTNFLQDVGSILGDVFPQIDKDKFFALKSSAFKLLSFHPLEEEEYEVDLESQSKHFDALIQSLERKKVFLASVIDGAKNMLPDDYPTEKIDAIIQLQTGPMRMEIEELERHISEHIKEQEVQK